MLSLLKYTKGNENNYVADTMGWWLYYVISTVSIRVCCYVSCIMCVNLIFFPFCSLMRFEKTNIGRSYP